MNDSYERAHKLMDLIDGYQLERGGKFAITVLPEYGKLPKVKSKDFAIVYENFVIIIPDGNRETPRLWKRLRNALHNARESLTRRFETE